MNPLAKVINSVRACVYLEDTHRSARILESIIGTKIGLFVSYIKWLGELRQCCLCVCSICTFDPTRLIFSKMVRFIFPIELSYFLLARVCYTVDCTHLYHHMK